MSTPTACVPKYLPNILNLLIQIQLHSDTGFKHQLSDYSVPCWSHESSTVHIKSATADSIYEIAYLSAAPKYSATNNIYRGAMYIAYINILASYINILSAATNAK